MLASTFAQWKGIDVTVGQSSTEVQPKDNDIVIVQINAAGHWRVTGNVVEPAEFVNALTKRRANGEQFTVLIQPVSGSVVQTLVDALGALQNSGFDKVGLVRDAL